MSCNKSDSRTFLVHWGTIIGERPATSGPEGWVHEYKGKVNFEATESVRTISSAFNNGAHTALIAVRRCDGCC
jgi:hypothetical protein